MYWSMAACGWAKLGSVAICESGGRGTLDPPATVAAKVEEGVREKVEAGWGGGTGVAERAVEMG